MKLYLYWDKDENYTAIATEEALIKQANGLLQEYIQYGNYKEYFENSEVDGIDEIKTFNYAIKVFSCLGILIKQLLIENQDATIENLKKYGWMEID